MAKTRERQFDVVTTFTLSLAPGGVGLANGSARQSTLIDNTANRPAAMVYIAIQAGAVAPTAGATYEVYLLRADKTVGSPPTYITDGAGTSDAAYAPTAINAVLLGTIKVAASASPAKFYGEFDTMDCGPLGKAWGIAIRNASGQAVNTVEANHLKEFAYYTDVYTP